MLTCLQTVTLWELEWRYPVSTDMSSTIAVSRSSPHVKATAPGHSFLMIVNVRFLLSYVTLYSAISHSSSCSFAPNQYTHTISRFNSLNFSTCAVVRTHFFPARLCSEVRNTSTAIISTFDNHFGVEVNYTCIDGYYFPDGAKSRVTFCNQYGKWTENIPDCTGIWFVYQARFSCLIWFRCQCST